MSKVPLFRGADGGLRSYLKSCNMDLRDGTIKPSPRQVEIEVTGGDDPAPTLIRWVQTAVVVAGLPAAWYGQGSTLKICWYGSVEDQATVTGTFTDVCRFETGASAAAIIGCYGNGDYIDRFDSAGTPTASTDVKLVYATMAGADLYGVGNKTGVTVAYSTYKVSKCPAGNDPLVAASWGTGLPVGSPMYPINSIRSLGNAVVVAKPEGVFVLDSTANAYVNRQDFEVGIHDDNGKGMFTGKGRVFVPMANGSLWMTDGFNFTDIGPKHFCIHHRDNPHLRAPITAGCVEGDWVYVATAPWEVGWTQEFGLKIYKYVAGTTTYTDITTNLVDGSTSTTATVGGLVTNDYIYVGADIPFEAVRFSIGTANTTASSGFTASGFYTAVISTPGWISTSTSYSDNTKSGTKGLAKDGYIRVLTDNDDYGAHPVMGKIAPPTGTGTPAAKYWARFKLVGTILAATTLSEIAILPSRPPIRSGTFGGTTAITLTNGGFEYTGPDNAGIFPHILAGRQGPNGWEWWDVFTVHTTGPIRAMAYMTLGTSQTEENAGPRLVMISQNHAHVAMMGCSDYVATPVNENYAGGVTMGTPIVYLAPADLSDSDTDRSTIQKQITEFDIYGEYVNSADTVTMFSRFDHNPWDTVQAVNTAPVRTKGLDGQEGLVLETALAYEDPAATEIAGPRITRVDVEFRDTDADFDAHPQRNAATPEIE